MFAFRDVLRWWFDVYIYKKLFLFLPTPYPSPPRPKDQAKTLHPASPSVGAWVLLHPEEARRALMRHIRTMFPGKNTNPHRYTNNHISKNRYYHYSRQVNICKHDAVTAHECSLICPYTWKMTSETGTLRSLHPVGTIHWRPSLHGGNTQHERNSLSSLDFQFTKKMQISQNFWTRTQCVIRRPFESCRLSVFLGCHWDA